MNGFQKILLMPMLRRMGTAVATSISTYLIAVGIPEDMVTNLLLGLSAGAAIAVDLFFANKAKSS